jgi:aerobic C4-dicarboxylate transport protein
MIAKPPAPVMTEGAGAPGHVKRPLIRELWFQVLAATLAGIVLGHFAPGAGTAMKPLGDAFVALVRMLIAPIVFCTVVHGIAGMGDMKRLGRVALKAIVYFEAITTLALIVALALVELLKPGAGMHVDARTLDAGTVASYVATAHQQSVSGFLLHLIPDTFASAFTAPDVLPVLFVSLLFGIAATLTGEPARPVVDLVARLGQIFFRVTDLVMRVAPIGAFGAIAFTVGKFGAGTLLSLGALIGEFALCCSLFTLLVFAGVARLAGIRLWRLLGYIKDEIVIVAATTSTETVLPRIIVKMKQAGCNEAVVGFVIPAGYSLNLDGTCLYLATVTVFLAQATGVHLSLGAELALMAILLLTSKGAAGVAGAAFVVLAATLGTTGTIPVASIALILGIHRILAEGLTFVNLVGNCLATVVVVRWEGAVDRERLMATLGRFRPDRR